MDNCTHRVIVFKDKYINWVFSKSRPWHRTWIWSLGIQVSMQLSWGTKKLEDYRLHFGYLGHNCPGDPWGDHMKRNLKRPLQRMEGWNIFSSSLENLTLLPLWVCSFMDSSIDLMPLKTLRDKCREMQSPETGHSHQFKVHLSQRQVNPEVR